MNKDCIEYRKYISILKEELIPAMGCTEPIAVAYCAAVARETLGAVPEKEYGLLRKSYLKEHKRGWYSSLLLTGKLDEHLAEIDRTCAERVELITNQLARREGVAEALKASDQMEWVARMNNIRAKAEEIVLSELVYN